MLLEPALSYRFRVEFSADVGDAIVLKLQGVTKCLTEQVLSFRYDSISKQFNLVFVIPQSYINDFYSYIKIITHFELQILDGNSSILRTEEFIIDKILKSTIEFNYTTTGPSELHIEGTYK
jgi:hypothetical protein